MDTNKDRCNFLETTFIHNPDQECYETDITAPLGKRNLPIFGDDGEILTHEIVASCRSDREQEVIVNRVQFDKWCKEGQDCSECPRFKKSVTPQNL